MNDRITVRPFEDSDLLPVLEVLKRALGETSQLRRTPELFAWKHFDNPFGRSIILLAEVGGRLAGVRALMKWELTTEKGRVVRCGRPVDTATDPDFARRGVFRALTKEAIEIAQTEGLELLFNTPNRKSGSGYLSMGWQEVGRIGVLARPSFRVRAPRPDPSSVEEPSLFEIGGLEDRPPRGLRTTRSQNYLSWRFTRHPFAKYWQVVHGPDVAVVRPNLRSGRRELLISDLFGGYSGGAVRAAARQVRSAYVASWFSKGSPERRALIKGGLLPVPGLRALTLMARPLTDVRFDFKTLTDWDIALSDLELL